MSYVALLTADHPLPLYNSGVCRSSTRQAAGRAFTVETPGFSVQPHSYYRHAVDSLGLALKPWQYQLDIAPTREDAAELRSYLAGCCRPGEQVELWMLWLGDDRKEHFPHYRGALADLDVDTLDQLCHPPMQDGCPGQCRMTVMI